MTPTVRQALILDWLNRAHPHAGRMFESALWIAADEHIPCRGRMIAHAYREICSVLMNEYSTNSRDVLDARLKKLADASEELRKNMGEAGLGQHLVYYYWRGVGGDGTRGLLLRYFERCSSTALAHALWSIGGGLEGKETISPVTLSALMMLWSDLSTQAEDWPELKRREMYRQFGRWFASGRFENQWALQELKRALHAGAGMLDVEEVLARLETLCSEYPREVADIVETLLRDERQLWQPLIWKAQVESLLRVLLNSADQAARQQAEQVVNQLVQNGSLFARDLLPRPAAKLAGTSSDPAGQAGGG